MFVGCKSAQVQPEETCTQKKMQKKTHKMTRGFPVAVKTIKVGTLDETTGPGSRVPSFLTHTLESCHDSRIELSLQHATTFYALRHRYVRNVISSQSTNSLAGHHNGSPGETRPRRVPCMPGASHRLWV